MREEVGNKDAPLLLTRGTISKGLKAAFRIHLILTWIRIHIWQKWIRIRVPIFHKEIHVGQTEILIFVAAKI